MLTPSESEQLKASILTMPTTLLDWDDRRICVKVPRDNLLALIDTYAEKAEQ